MEISLPKNNVYSELIEDIAVAIKGTKWANSVFLCGGCVRDLLLGREIHDIDFVVQEYGGSINFARWICKEYGCYREDSNPIIYENSRCVKFNIKTISKFKDINIEVSDTKGIEEPFGTLLEDCLMRDLTINALYMDICTKKILDPSRNGLNDLKNGILRTPYDATKIFTKDPIKMLRIMRFHTLFGFAIERKTWLGIVTNAFKINGVAQEKITSEINKILLAEFPSMGLRKMYHCGLLKRVLPEVYALIGCEQGEQHFGDAFEHTMSVVDRVHQMLPHRLGALFHDIAKPQCRCTVNGKVHFFSHEYSGATLTSNIMKRMKYANNITDMVVMGVKNHMRFKQNGNKCPSDKVIRKFMNDMENSDNMAMVLDIINADNASHAIGYCMLEQVGLIINKIIELRDKEETESTKAILPINGHDIMEHFKLKKGPRIGYFLDVVRDAFYENPNITKEECFKEIEKVMHLDIV